MYVTCDLSFETVHGDLAYYYAIMVAAAGDESIVVKLVPIVPTRVPLFNSPKNHCRQHHLEREVVAVHRNPPFGTKRTNC